MQEPSTAIKNSLILIGCSVIAVAIPICAVSAYDGQCPASIQACVYVFTMQWEVFACTVALVSLAVFKLRNDLKILAIAVILLLNWGLGFFVIFARSEGALRYWN